MDIPKVGGQALELLRSYDEGRKLYVSFCETSADLIKRLLEARGIAVHSISYRCKDRASLEKKIIKKNKYKSISDVTDLVGVRVITHYSDDVDVVAKIIEDEFEVDQANSIDKRASLDPDRFGYLSLHYVASFVIERSRLQEYAAYKGLKLEIQIRSILQHTWAEIEHDIGYKNKYDIPVPVKRKFSRLAGLLELADQEFISIRDENVAYAEKLDDTIKDGYAGIGLDVISLEKFVNSDQCCSEIMDKFKEKVSFEECPHVKDSGMMRRLASFGIDTIEQLSQLLQKHKEELVRMFVEVQKLPDDEEDDVVQLTPAAPVFFLCHLLASKLSADGILEYVQTNEWFDQVGGEEFYELLLNFNGVRHMDQELALF